MRRPLRVFQDLTSVDGRLGFYTRETKERIPEQPGCYAWFLPLWIYDRDLDRLMTTVGEVYGYEQEPEKSLTADFSWHSVGLRVRSLTPAKPVSSDLRGIWDRILSDDEAKAALEALLIEASLLMPPLYVGRTANLKARYQQHVMETTGRNDFHTRVMEFVAASGLSLRVSDLLFACVRTHDDLNRKLGKFDNVERLVEQILMRFCRPPFSLK